MIDIKTCTFIKHSTYISKFIFQSHDLLVDSHINVVCVDWCYKYPVNDHFVNFYKWTYYLNFMDRSFLHGNRRIYVILKLKPISVSTTYGSVIWVRHVDYSISSSLDVPVKFISTEVWSNHECRNYLGYGIK